jgi:nicotinamidase-related amidase
VLHTASTAALHDYRPVIVEDAVGYLDETDREYALEHAEWLFGETTPREDIDFTRPSP